MHRIFHSCGYLPNSNIMYILGNTLEKLKSHLSKNDGSMWKFKTLLPLMIDIGSSSNNVAFKNETKCYVCVCSILEPLCENHLWCTRYYQTQFFHLVRNMVKRAKYNVETFSNIWLLNSTLSLLKYNFWAISFKYNWCVKRR